MSEPKITQDTVLKDLESLAKSVKDFPYYNLSDQKQLKFGQYVSVIEANRKNILDKINRLQHNLILYLAELQYGKLK